MYLLRWDVSTSLNGAECAFSEATHTTHRCNCERQFGYLEIKLGRLSFLQEVAHPVHASVGGCV